MMDEAVGIVRRADVLIVVGTSLNVYPAAGLVDIVPSSGHIFLVDPAPMEINAGQNLTVVAEKATIGLPIVSKALHAL